MQTFDANPTGDQGRHPSLRDYLSVIRRYRWIVLATTLLGVGVALIVSALQERTYEAEASISFREPAQDVQLIGLPTVISEAPEVRAAAGAEAATRQDLLERVRRRLGIRRSLDDFQDDVDARAEVRTNLVVVQARDQDRERAVKIASSIARAVVREERARERERLDKLIRATARENRQGLAGSDFLTRVQRRELQKLLVQLRATRDFTAPAEIVVPAASRADAVSPRPVRNVIVGFFGGLLLGILLTFLRAALDRRLRGADQLAGADVALLGVVRKDALGRPGFGLPSDDDSKSQADLDAIRIIRTNLEHLDQGRRIRTVLVTSPLPEEGKSTVALALATSMTLAGRRVLLLEGDLRRPVLSRRLGINDRPGLTDFIAAGATSQESLQAVALPGHASTNGAANGSSGGPLLACMTAGSPPPRHAEVLASDTFTDFLGVTSRAYDMVVIDSAPLLPAVDTLQLVERVDAIVLCVRADQTKRDELDSAMKAVRRLTDAPVGLVVTDVRRGQDPVYGYYAYSAERQPV